VKRLVGCHFVPIFGKKHLKNGFFGLCEPISPILRPIFMIFSDFPDSVPNFRMFLQINHHILKSNVQVQAEARLGADSLEPMVGVIVHLLVRGKV
jgi:hypothetical protein